MQDTDELGETEISLVTFRETERASPTAQKAQGDIIRIENSADANAPSLGVVINADCDLANGKLDGVIAYLPIYSFKDYIAKFWAPGHIAEIQTATTRRILEILGDKAAEAESLQSWVLTDGPRNVSTALTDATSLKKGRADSISRDVAKLAITLDETLGHFDRFVALCKEEKSPSGHARKQLTAANKSMGDGHFQISDLVDHEDIGFVIRMRRIYTISEANCFSSVSEQLASSQGDAVSAVRIGRLTELYRFKVAQLFAQQFSRIGLPDEVTALSGLMIDDAVAQVEKDFE